MSYTYVLLQVPPAMFEFVKAKFEEHAESGYLSQIHDDGKTLDMHGIALQALPLAPVPAPGTAFVVTREDLRELVDLTSSHIMEAPQYLATPLRDKLIDQMLLERGRPSGQ